MRRWWIVFFASIGLGALLGGIYHGFVSPPHPLSGVVSKGTLLSIGITASACWIVGAAIGSGDRGVVWAMRLAAAQFVAYSAVVFGVTTAFIVAIAAYLPATLFLLAMLILRYRRAPARELVLGISGFLLTIVAAAVQGSASAFTRCISTTTHFTTSYRARAVSRLSRGAMDDDESGPCPEHGMIS